LEEIIMSLKSSRFHATLNDDLHLGRKV